MKATIRFLSALLIVMLGLSVTALAETAEPTEAELLAERVASIVLPSPELPLTEETVSFSLMYPKTADHGDFDGMFYLEALEQSTGVRLDIQAIDANGWDEKLALSFASGDYGEIFINGVSFNDAAIYGQAGMLRPLEDLIEQYAPNIQTIFELIPETKRNVTAPDGHIYMMAAYDGTPRDMLMNATYNQEINGSWLEAVGMDVPTTLDEFYDMLVAFKNEDPNGNGEADEIPWSFVYDGEGYNMVLGAFGFVNLRHDVIDGQYVYVPAQENFRHYLEFMHKLYSEGLVDSDIFTMTAEEYNAKMSTMSIGFMPNSGAAIIGMDNYLDTVNLHPLTSEYNETPIHPGRAQEVDKYGMVITDKCSEEKAILAIKLLDYFYSQEGTFLIKCGPEYGAWGDMIDGGYVRHEDADGTVSYELVYDEDKYTGYWEFRIKNGLMNMPFFYTAAHAEVIIGADAANNHLTEIVNDCGMLSARRLGYPQMATFTEDEQDILAPFVLMDSFVDQSVAKFITGETEINDDTWNEYLENLEMMDLQTLIEVRQAAYDRWNSQDIG